MPVSIATEATQCGAGFAPSAKRALLSLLALCAGLLVTVGAHAAPPLKIDLDQFDNSRQRVALANGLTMAYVDVGPRNGPVTVLIHGYTSNARGWVPLLPYLDPQRRYLIPDIRGHGQSDKPECCYTRVDFAYDVKLLLDALQIPQADIVGTSLGSIIAQTFAEYWPQRTRRVVLKSSTGGMREGCIAAANDPPAMDYRTSITKLSDPIDPESPFMIEWYASPSPVDAEFLRRQRRDAARIPVAVWLAVLDQGLTSLDLQSTLPRLKAPTLLIWGEKDSIFGSRDRCSLRAALPQAEVKIFKELGHNAYWEDPAAVAAVINPFLAR